ncbi:hypothetical protein [Chryseobacterium sp. T1]
MSDTKQKALDFFKSNANTKEVFATVDGFLFLKKNDALTHAKTLDEDNPTIETFSNGGNLTKKQETLKLSVAEYKELKEKATVEYKELFGADPDSKLSGAKIQELNDAKKLELANAND